MTNSDKALDFSNKERRTKEARGQEGKLSAGEGPEILVFHIILTQF